jgi:flagellar motor switch protein FliN
MDTDPQAAANWFPEQFALRLAEVFEAMAGARPEVRTAGPSTALEAGGSRWRQSFNGASGAVWIHAADAAWTEAGNRILRAAGIDDADQPTLKSTWSETLGQALSSLARDFSGRVDHEVTCASGEESTEPGPAQWTRFSIQAPGEPAPFAEIFAAIDDALSGALTAEPEPKTAAASAAAAPGPLAAAPSGPSSSNSRTFDLLLDVELPVSVSFGRAQVPLKDVIKLTTGAIVELNRSITEPVEVIVNNCVIARGEVVVVEGNFGVRIREVISRQERLRTLN